MLKVIIREFSLNKIAEFMSKMIVSRNLILSLFASITFVLYYESFRDLIKQSLHNELYSHIILMPIISLYFIILNKKVIFSKNEHSLFAGGFFIAFSVTLYLAGHGKRLEIMQNDYFSLMIFSAVLFCLGGFLLIFGSKAFNAAKYPLLLLFFMVPIPSPILDAIVHLLQRGSAEVAYVLFKLTGVTFLREGFTFYLDVLTVEVAEQCSGIRSTIALFIVSIVAGQLFLETFRNKMVLSLSVIPVAIFKNGVRIVTLTLLGAYVDERILSSTLHKSGGIPFFVIALIIWTPILWVLKKSEIKGKAEKTRLTTQLKNGE